MKLLDYILFSAAVGLLIIGIYETFIGNFKTNYWIFMLMLICLFIYGYRKQVREDKAKEAAEQQATEKSPKAKNPKGKKKR